MGYYVEYEINVIIPKENEGDVLKAINHLHDPEVMQKNASGGSWQGGERKEVWYSWTDNPPAGGFPSVEHALRAWRFQPCYLDGELTFCFEGEKLGDEEKLFEAIAPYITGDIYARGGDGCEWGFRFNFDKMVTLRCTKTWEEV